MMPTVTWQDAVEALRDAAEEARAEAAEYRARGRVEESHDWDDEAAEQAALAEALDTAANRLDALAARGRS